VWDWKTVFSWSLGPHRGPGESGFFMEVDMRPEEIQLLNDAIVDVMRNNIEQAYHTNPIVNQFVKQIIEMFKKNIPLEVIERLIQYAANKYYQELL